MAFSEITREEMRNRLEMLKTRRARLGQLITRTQDEIQALTTVLQLSERKHLETGSDKTFSGLVVQQLKMLNGRAKSRQIADAMVNHGFDWHGKGTLVAAINNELCRLHFQESSPVKRVGRGEYIHERSA